MFLTGFFRSVREKHPASLIDSRKRNVSIVGEARTRRGSLGGGKALDARSEGASAAAERRGCRRRRVLTHILVVLGHVAVTHIATLDVEQCHRVDPNAPGDSFDAAQRQVVLAALDSAEVRPVNTEDVREGLLAQALSLTVGPEATSHPLL